MAQGKDEHIIGLDVSKATLDVFEWHSRRAYSIANDTKAIEHRLAGLEAPARLALEPTNDYHTAVAAYAHGHQVYLIDPYRVAHYRSGVGHRVKADPQDGSRAHGRG
jgi:transposase